MAKKIPLEGKKRWRVLFRESDRWLAGLYIPENRTREDVKVLEKHNASELFMLLDGNVTLVLKSDRGKARNVPLRKNELVIVDEWHNGYGRGKALVIERSTNRTESMEL